MGEDVLRHHHACLLHGHGHHILHLRDLPVQVVAEQRGKDDGAQEVEDGCQDHDQDHRAGRVHMVMEAGAEGQSQKRRRDGVEDRREAAAEQGDHDHADKDRHSAPQTVFRGIGSHRQRKNVHESFLEETAGLAVQEDQDAEDGDEHCSESQFLRF